MSESRIRVATVITRLEAGAGAVALRGALALDPARFETTIIAGSGNRLLDDARDAGLEIVVEPALVSPIAPRDDVRALRRLTRLLTARRFDVAHTHSAKAGALGRLAARHAGINRIVHTYHGFPFHEFQSTPVRATYIAIERKLGTFTDLALCVGGGVAAEAVRRRLIAPDRISTIGVATSGSTTPRTPRTREQARRALGLPPGAAVVGAVGRLAYQKAPEDFVRAMITLGRDDVVGVWIGDGPLASRVRELAAHALPRARLVLTGDRADVRDLLPALDVFALPSRYEGLPVAIMEAMACGVPVVATAVNAVPDVVVPGRTGLLVPPCRPELLARALRHLLDNPHEADRMAHAALAAIGDRFDSAALGQALTGAYIPSPERRPARPDQEIPCA